MIFRSFNNVIVWFSITFLAFILLWHYFRPTVSKSDEGFDIMHVFDPFFGKTAKVIEQNEDASQLPIESFSLIQNYREGLQASMNVEEEVMRNAGNIASAKDSITDLNKRMSQVEAELESGLKRIQTNEAKVGKLQSDLDGTKRAAENVANSV